MVFRNSNIGRLIYESLNKPVEKTASKKFSASNAAEISENLTKIASVPYTPESQVHIKEMLKIASNCIGQFTEAFQELESRNNELEKIAEVRIILDDMIDYGLVDPNNVNEKIAELVGKDLRRLEITKEAVNLVKNNNGKNIFSESDDSFSSGSFDKKGMFDGVLD